MFGTTEEAFISDICNELQYMDTPVLVNQEKLTFISFVQTLDAV